MSVYSLILHLCDGTTSPLGRRRKYGSFDEARASAIRHAREIMIAEIAHGRLCLTCWIVIKNEDGHSVATLPFGEAVEMIDHPMCEHSPKPALNDAAASPRR